VILPLQVCLELHNLLVRQGKYARADAERIVDEFASGASLVDTNHELMQLGFALAEVHHLQTFDAVIFAAAAVAGCEFLYSEDMQDGFEWNGVRVVNPFA
jgi:predicted nucleic acid-binding protein